MAWGNRFDPLGSFDKRKQQQAAKASNQKTKEVKVKTDNDKWNIYVEGGEWDKNGQFRFLICGAFYPDLDKLDKTFASNGIFHCNVRDNQQGVGRWLVVRPGKMDEFQTILPDIINYFQVQTTKYKESSLGELPDGFYSAIKDAPTWEEIEQQRSKVADNWKDIVAHLTADTSSKILLKTQTTFINDPKYSAAALSRDNVIEILMVDPDATFYAGEWAWNHVFKRRIKSGAPYAIITKPSIPGQKAAHGEKWATTKYNNITNKRAQTFFKIRAYDIRYTELIDPNDDPFATLTNELSNNINPKLNPAYQDALSQSGVNTNDIVSNEPQYGLSNEKSQDMFLQHIVNLCKNENIQLDTTDAFENIISKGVYEYAIVEAIRLNKLKEKDQQSFAYAVLVAVARSYNLDSPMIKNAFSKLQSTPSTQLENMSRAMFPVYRKLVSFSRYVKEAVDEGNIMSFEEFTEFVSSLGQTPNKVLDQFNSFSKRMNDVGRE